MRKSIVIVAALSFLVSGLFVIQSCKNATGPEPVKQYTLTTSATNGSVVLTPAGGTYNSGTVVTLNATPAANYAFSSWSGDLTGSTNPTTITMTSNKSVTANFTATTPVVTTTKGKLEGRWYGDDPILDNKWIYDFKGNTIKIKKATPTDSTPDTTLIYSGLFTLDSSATPTKLDIQLTNAAFTAFTGQTIKTLYEYRGALGSFILCVFLKNDPGAARPVDLSDPNGDTMLLGYFDFAYASGI